MTEISAAEAAARLLRKCAKMLEPGNKIAQAMRMGAEALEASAPRVLTPEEIMKMDDNDAVWLFQTEGRVLVESGRSAKMRIMFPPKHKSPYGDGWWYYTANPKP